MAESSSVTLPPLAYKVDDEKLSIELPRPASGPAVSSSSEAETASSAPVPTKVNEPPETTCKVVSLSNMVPELKVVGLAMLNVMPGGSESEPELSHTRRSGKPLSVESAEM